MKYVFIEKHQAEFSIKAMCRVLRVARSGWYTWCQRRTRISTRQQFRQHCDSVVLAAFTRSKQRYGAPRLTDELRAQGYPFNVKTVAASLRRQGLRAKASRKFSPVSYRAHGLPVSENLLEQDFYASCAVMRGDIDQPITARDHRSMTTARYSQPSSVRKYVMSPAHFWFGPLA